MPLARRGVAVHGIDLSPAVLAQLRTQPGADVIAVTVGDLASTTVSEAFRLAYLLRNTITNLTTQDEQVDCFRNIAAHLESGGLFVIENYIPALQQIPPGDTIRVFTRTPTRVPSNPRDQTSGRAHRHHGAAGVVASAPGDFHPVHGWTTIHGDFTDE